MHIEKELHNLRWLLKQVVILELKETNISNTQPETEYHFLLTFIEKIEMYVLLISQSYVCRKQEKRDKKALHTT